MPSVISVSLPVSSCPFCHPFPVPFPAIAISLSPFHSPYFLSCSLTTPIHSSFLFLRHLLLSLHLFPRQLSASRPREQVQYTSARSAKPLHPLFCSEILKALLGLPDNLGNQYSHEARATYTSTLGYGIVCHRWFYRVRIVCILRCCWFPVSFYSL